MPPTLDTLPAELLAHILQYADIYNPDATPFHPLQCLAATTHCLRDAAEEVSRLMLNKHAKLTKFPRTVIYRAKWLRWLNTSCWFCKKTSQRKAIFQDEERGPTCCAKCDRAQFPKMTMTEAIANHGLSKLDLFTPNRLLDLPTLTNGEYFVMGNFSTMLSKPDVLARKAYIHGLLGEKAKDEGYLRRRAAAHERIIKHMNARVQHGRVHERTSFIDPVDTSKTTASMRTPEGRANYVTEHLRRERAALGM
ncbi:hypothetical protein EJ04DRAFT_516556 [Polyplosphaeria fusca]|uniref:Uncharacterized protein n=1 Tax=Polyplosphaeria fusca TaxID=682080 RepID=A0A9P4QJK2_9PLEO|nr:hypothetical protein EJ04DRAFT_516556 [Polyplosphaeria fusca]